MFIEKFPFNRNPWANEHGKCRFNGQYRWKLILMFKSFLQKRCVCEKT